MENRILNIGGLNFQQYLSAEQIEAAIEDIARRVDRDYRSIDTPLVMLVTLSGAMMFAAELSKRLTIDVQWAFVKCSSYETELCSSGNVKMVIEPTIDISGREVLVVEDVVDTGNTWCALYPYLKSRAPRSLKIATMLLKPEVFNKSLPVDYVGMEIENVFVVGYGLDYNQSGRNLNGIYRKQ